MGRRREPIRHGTGGGYRAHYRHGVPMCEACRDFDRKSKGRSPQPRAKCGTRSGYNRHKRLGELVCADCTAANARASRQYRRTHAPNPLSPWDSRHGTVNAYSNFGCRCAPCKAANARASQDLRDARKEAS